MFSGSFVQRPTAARNSSADSAALLLGVSVAGVPVLLAIVMMRLAQQRLEQLGVSSEEVFRGERLPVLPFPDQS